MRQIALDTETTGLEFSNGHRIIEIGCIELVDRQLTGNYFHYYLNPEREIDEQSVKIHGITHTFLQDKPKFIEISEALINFLSDSEVIIHNAAFDVGFLNSEFERCHFTKQIKDICKVFDTLPLARKLHPGQRNNLDALCKRYQVNNSHRKYHGALLDAELLAHVYLAMTGGQIILFSDEIRSTDFVEEHIQASNLQDWAIPIIPATTEEKTQHQLYLDKIKAQIGKLSLWEQLVSESS